MRVRLSASAPKGEPQPCIRQSPRAPASRGPAARRDAPGSRRASPGERPIPRGSSSRRTTASARNGHPPNRSCKLGSSCGPQTPWSLAPGSSVVPFPFLPVHRSQCVCYSSRRSPSLKKLDSSAPLRPQRYYGIKCLVLGASTKWAIIGHRLRVANFGERRHGEVRRISLARTSVNRRSKLLLQAPALAV
jgi:hypothetical protein